MNSCQTPDNASQPASGRLLIFSMLTLIPLLIFIPVCNYEFLEWDDPKNILENPNLFPVTLEKIFRFWTAPFEHLYIPMTYTVWGVETFISQKITGSLAAEPKPVIFHSCNLILHLLNTLLLFRLIKNFIGCRIEPDKAIIAASFGALFFAVHPIQAESIAWVTGMKDILSAFFSLLALNIYFSKAKMRQQLTCLLSTFFFILAVLSKPSAISLPVIIVVIDKWIFNRRGKDVFLPPTIWLLTGAVITVASYRAQPTLNMDFIPSPLIRPFIANDALFFYIYKVLFPVQLSNDYGRTPLWVISGSAVYFTTVMVVTLGVISFLSRKKIPLLFASLCIFAAATLPYSGFIPFAFQDVSTVADRYLYFAMLGPSLLVSWLISLSVKKGALSVICIYMALLATLSSYQIRPWHDTLSLFKSLQKKNESSAISDINIGNAYLRKGRWEEAGFYLKRAIEVRHKNPVAYNNLGIVSMYNHEWEEALAHFAKALELNHDFIDAHFNIAKAYQKTGNEKKALWHLTYVLRKKNTHVKANYEAARIFAGMGKLKEALKHNNMAINENKYFVNAYIAKGDIYARTNMLDAALKEYKKALEIEPDLSVAFNNIGVTYFRKTEVELSISYFMEGIKKDPENAELYANLGTVLYKSSRISEALVNLNKALNIDKNHNRASAVLRKIKEEGAPVPLIR